nr:E3 ubiquitin-protein ligase Siah1-like [Rhipicephalus microplus]
MHVWYGSPLHMMCDWLYGFWQKSGLGTGAGGGSGGGSCRSGRSSWPPVGAEGCSCGSAVHGSKEMSHVAVQSNLLRSPSTVACARLERGRVDGVSLAVQSAAEVMASVISVFDPPRTQTTTSVSQMSSLLECPICRNYALPPIMQCENGHHLCAPCRKNVAMCPVCRAPKGNNRNLALEKLAESTLFPCKYRSKGCTTSLLIADKKRHENSCERGENVVVTATNFRRVEAFCWMALQTCLGRDFVVMLRKRNNRASSHRFLGAVLLIGSSEEARRFLYQFDLRGAEHRLSWSARTRNLHSQADTDRSGDGLVLDMSTAERLCNGADLIMDVTISNAPSLSGDNVL